jgi:hypothetical protein
MLLVQRHVTVYKIKEIRGRRYTQSVLNEYKRNL